MRLRFFRLVTLLEPRFCSISMYLQSPLPKFANKYECMITHACLILFAVAVGGMIVVVVVAAVVLVEWGFGEVVDHSCNCIVFCES